MPKLRVTEIPEGQEELYEKDGDTGYILKQTYLDGVETKISEYKSKVNDYDDLTTKVEELKSKNDEFRQNNIALKKKLEESGGGDPGKYNDEFKKALDEALEPIKKKNTDLESQNTSLSSQLTEIVLSDKVKTIALQDGVYETALPDVVSRAKNVFTVKNGKAVPKDEKERDDNGELITPEKWIKKLVSDAPHFFKETRGGGARKPNSRGSGKGDRTSTQKIEDGLKSLDN